MHSNKPQDLSIEKIPFAGGEIHALNQDGIIFVSLRKVCEELGVNFSSQLQKLKEIASQGEVWAGVVIIATPSAGGEQQTTMLPADSLPMFLITINNNKVKEEIRPKLLQYKNEAAKVLANHFGKNKQQEPLKIGRAIVAIGEELLRLDAEQERILARITRIEEVIAKPAKRLLTQKTILKNIREAFSMDVSALHRQLSSKKEDHQELNSTLKRITGRKRENWDIEHYRAAFDYLDFEFSFTAARTLEALDRFDSNCA